MKARVKALCILRKTSPRFKEMPAKQPVFIGTVVRSPQDGGPDVPTDVIVNVSDALYQVFGSPVLDPDKLAGKVQDGPNGQFRFPKKGTTNGKTVTLISDGNTPGGAARTYQMQLPRICPLHVLDKFLSATTFVGDNILFYKAEGGIRTPVGQSVVA